MSGYREPYLRELGRTTMVFQRGSLNLPRLGFLIEDYTEVDGVKHERTMACFSYGNGNSDPVLSVDVELEGTWLGRLIRRIDDWIFWRRQ